jgi:hypothetical protein
MASKRRPHKGPMTTTKPKSKPKPVEEILFTRDNGKRVPIRIQDAADLWLDMFMNIAGMTAPERSESHFKVDADNQRLWLLSSAECADYGLELYESRWPHMARKD